MRLHDPEQLAQVGLTLYERKALMALMLCGVADASTLCREGAVPTSKIYLAMEKLAGLGLVQVQPTRPKMFAALPPDLVVARIVEIVRERADRFASQAADLQATFTGLRSRARGRHPFLDLTLGVEGHIRRHLVPLAAARKRILSYLEAGDLMAIDTAIKDGFPILRRIAKNAAEHGVEHRVVFGFSYQSAGQLVEFLKTHWGSVLRRAWAPVPCRRRRHRRAAARPPVREGGPLRVLAGPGPRARGQPRRRVSGAVAEGDDQPP
jgi:hypothetical protein